MSNCLTEANLIAKWNSYMIVLYKEYNVIPMYNYKLSLLETRQRNTKQSIATFIRKKYLGCIL